MCVAWDFSNCQCNMRQYDSRRLYPYWRRWAVRLRFGSMYKPHQFTSLCKILASFLQRGGCCFLMGRVSEGGTGSRVRWRCLTGSHSAAYFSGQLSPPHGTGKYTVTHKITAFTSKLMFRWPCISIQPHNENQLDALFILNLFRQPCQQTVN